jgi:hypothetical protein
MVNGFWDDGLKNYFEKNKDSLKDVRKFVRIYIPSGNVLNPISIKKLSKIKNSIYGNA